MKKNQETEKDRAGLGWCIVIIVVIVAAALFIQFGDLFLG